jgi:hypothetical protein
MRFCPRSTIASPVSNVLSPRPPSNHLLTPAQNPVVLMSLACDIGLIAALAVAFRLLSATALERRYVVSKCIHKLSNTMHLVLLLEDGRDVQTGTNKVLNAAISHACTELSTQAYRKRSALSHSRGKGLDSLRYLRIRRVYIAPSIQRASLFGHMTCRLLLGLQLCHCSRVWAWLLIGINPSMQTPDDRSHR